jgi:hypothetical protein
LVSHGLLSFSTNTSEHEFKLARPTTKTYVSDGYDEGSKNISASAGSEAIKLQQARLLGPLTSPDGVQKLLW